ncbi:MAG: AI-2E family transporter [Pseudomonadales bacterium]
MTDIQRVLVLLALVIAGGLVYLLQPILAPFLVGALIAYLGDPLADRLEAWGLGRTSAVGIVFLVMTLLVTLVLFLLLPLLGRQVDAFITRLPEIAEWAQSVALPWLSHQFNLPPYELPIDDLKNLLANHWQKAGSMLKLVMQKVTASSLAFLGWFANLVLIPVVAFYLLRDWDVLITTIRELLPRRLETTIVDLAAQCDTVLSAFLRGQLLIMFLLGIIYTIGLTIVGLDLALLLGMIAGLASVVPYMGVILGIVTSGIAALVQFHDWWHLLAVLIVFGVGQVLEGMILTPLLVGDRIGLHPVAVIFAILAGGQLAGFVGILIALPVAAVLMVLLRHAHQRYKVSSIYGDTEDENDSSLDIDDKSSVV